MLNIKTKEAITSVSFSIKKGEVIALAGQNGAGKTTLLKSIIGLLPKFSGTIKINGNIGFMPEGATPDPKLTVSEFIKYICFLNGFDNSLWIFEKCGLNDFLHTKCSNLSKGLKQRVMLGAALAGKPDILILDEPSAGLDPLFQVELIDLIKLISKNITVIISTHNISEIKDLAKRVIVLKNGKVSYTGSSEGNSYFEYF